MNIFYAFILGVTQGLTEFLPISSSGHLSIIARVLGIEASLGFDLVIHCATALAVIIHCRKQLPHLIKKPFAPFPRAIIIATVISAVVVLIVKPFAQNFFNGWGLGIFFALTALLLVFSTFYSPKKTNALPTTFQAVMVGFMQGLAVFPGLSRSATTFTTANALGLEKKSNTSFCFLLSVPIIIGSSIVSLFTEQLVYVPFPCLLIGFISAFISGLLALRCIEKIFLNKNLLPFALYTAIVAVILTLNDCFWGIF